MALPPGTIVVANGSEDGPRALFAVDPTNIFTGVAVEPTGNLVSQGDKIRAPSGVAVEASGAILVLDLTGAVIRVDPTTGAQTTVTTGDNLRGARGLTVRR
jgi:hypothetical protein